MKAKTLYLISLFLISIFTFITCQKEDLDSETLDTPVFKKSEVNSALEEIAGVFVDAINDKNFRSTIRNEALIEYHEDYIMLKSSLKSTGENQIARVLKDLPINYDYERIQFLVTKIPNYEISVPVNCEEWEVESHKPLVAYIPEDFNELIHHKIKALDNDGKVVWLDTKSDPAVPVILIRPKEEIDLSKYRSEKERNTKSTRIDGQSEFIKTIRTSNISYVESWVTGPRCEIKVVTVSSKTGTIISTDFFNPKRKDIDKKEKTVNHKLNIWKTNDWGHYLTMQWYEEDGGATVSTSIAYKTESGLTSTITYSVKNEDDNLGLKTVSFSDPIGFEYNSGRWQWKMNNSDYCPYLGSWDGANCYIGTAPNGTEAFYLKETHSFYYTPLPGNQCPYPGSGFDGANCWVMSYPTEASPFILNNSWYLEPYNF